MPGMFQGVCIHVGGPFRGAAVHAGVLLPGVREVHIIHRRRITMILFRSKGQFLILPTIGFVRDGDAIMLNISWMMFGMVITLYNIMEK